MQVSFVSRRTFSCFEEKVYALTAPSNIHLMSTADEKFHMAANTTLYTFDLDHLLEPQETKTNTTNFFFGKWLTTSSLDRIYETKTHVILPGEMTQNVYRGKEGNIIPAVGAFELFHMGNVPFRMEYLDESEEQEVDDILITNLHSETTSHIKVPFMESYDSHIVSVNNIFYCLQRDVSDVSVKLYPIVWNSGVGTCFTKPMAVYPHSQFVNGTNYLVIHAWNNNDLSEGETYHSRLYVITPCRNTTETFPDEI